MRSSARDSCPRGRRLARRRSGARAGDSDRSPSGMPRPVSRNAHGDHPPRAQQRGEQRGRSRRKVIARTRRRARAARGWGASATWRVRRRGVDCAQQPGAPLARCGSSARAGAAAAAPPASAPAPPRRRTRVPEAAAAASRSRRLRAFARPIDRHGALREQAARRDEALTVVCSMKAQSTRREPSAPSATAAARDARRHEGRYPSGASTAPDREQRHRGLEQAAGYVLGQVEDDAHDRERREQVAATGDAAGGERPGLARRGRAGCALPGHRRRVAPTSRASSFGRSASRPRRG